MLNITLISVGRIKEEYFRAACSEYEKRLGGYCRFASVTVDAEKLSDNPSEKEIKAVLNKEGANIIKKIPRGAYTAALCIEGKEMDSLRLSETIEKISFTHSSIAFIIGSSFGLSPEVKEHADLKLSMSPMTFPHELARVMLLEQIYRSLSILENGKYHK